MAAVGLFVCPLIALIAYLLLPAGGAGGGGLNEMGRRCGAVGVLMAGWWLTEAIPLSATALLPLVLFPLLGVSTMKAAAAPYADEVIFMFLGGMLLGLAMERWGLHRRIALVTILIVGTRPRALVAGFMIAPALISMWVSNTAAAVMMLPIGLSVVRLVGEQARSGSGDDAKQGASERRNLATCIVLGIAYAASIGGVGTLIGTPPNAVLAGFAAERYGQTIGFVQWMRLGVPLMVVFLPLAWVVLVLLFPVGSTSVLAGRGFIRAQLRAEGPMKRGEWAVLVVFVLAVTAWVLRAPLTRMPGLGGLTDAGIAMTAAAALFLVPVNLREGVFVLDWRQAERVPWGVLILFGGGLSLAGALSQTGVDKFLGSGFAAMHGVPVLVLVLVVALGVALLSELASNTAVVTALLPVLAAASDGLEVHPYLLLVPATLAASLAFMLPVGTPPNALAYATGHVSTRQMMRAGIVLDLAGVAVITLLVYFAGSWLLGVPMR